MRNLGAMIRFLLTPSNKTAATAAAAAAAVLANHLLSAQTLGTVSSTSDDFSVLDCTVLYLNSRTYRSTKVKHILKNERVELAWWFPVTGDQFRITGKAYLCPRPDHALNAIFHDEHAKRLSPPGLLYATPLDWEAERWRIFGKLIPPIRAGFSRPPPGTPLLAEKRKGDQADEGEEKEYDTSAWAPVITMEDKQELIHKAYNNFALL